MMFQSKRLAPGSFLVLVLVTIFLSFIYSATRQAIAPSSVSNLLTETNAPPGFSYATAPRKFSFPKDHGQHLGFRSEWWYFTGNVYDRSKRHYGFDLTIFRFGLAPSLLQDFDSLRTSQIFLAHFAISDTQTARYLNAEKYSRELPSIAEIKDRPVKVQVENWFIEQTDAEKEHWRLQAATEDFGLTLDLSALRPIALQGDAGLSKKSSTPGNASYYYSIPKLSVDGELTLAGQDIPVTGYAWFDREWSTSALEPGQIGWDWFGLHLNDTTELMYYQIRHANGKRDEQSHGSLFLDGGQVQIPLGPEVELQPLAYWRSPETNARYPIAWRLRAEKHQLDIEIKAKFNDQQWNQSFIYWEGAVSVTGRVKSQPVNGEGFVELTGYDRGN